VFGKASPPGTDGNFRFVPGFVAMVQRTAPFGAARRGARTGLTRQNPSKNDLTALRQNGATSPAW
jgi:hypothetical protein